jgi:gamma-glutamyltranspeptidase/glutathione hydrolase
VIRARAAAIGSEPVAEAAASEQLAAGGGALDAVLAGLFAAAGNHPGVLLGPVSVLIAGVGQGARAFDGRVRQPGLGAKRPRGFAEDEPIPNAARVGAPGALAAVVVAHAYSNASLRAVVRPGILAAERVKAERRAELLERVAQVGASVLSEAIYRRGLSRVGSASEGGLITSRDLEPGTEIDVAAAEIARTDQRYSVVPWGEPRGQGALPEGRGEAVGAIDVHGMLAAVSYRVVDSGMWIEELEMFAPLAAVPVKRGVPRVTPGTRLAAPAPMAIRWDGTHGPNEVLLEPASAALDPEHAAGARLILRRDPATRLVESRRA